MSGKAYATLLLLAFLSLAATPAAAQSANGIYEFNLGDDLTKHVEFDARKLADGSAVGSIFLSDPAPLVYRDVDGTGQGGAKYNGFYIKAEVDGFVLADKNQAVMSATVRDSSVPELLGLRFLLTVEDNGQDPRVPDRLTWGAYKFTPRTWIPSDAEWKEDPGVGLRWWAKDAERRDDVGYAMPIEERPVGTTTFPFASYAFADVRDGVGDIVVNP